MLFALDEQSVALDELFVHTRQEGLRLAVRASTGIAVIGNASTESAFSPHSPTPVAEQTVPTRRVGRGIGGNS